MNKKKSQLFLFDLIMSFVVLVVSLGIAFSYYSISVDDNNYYKLSQEIINSITNTELNSLNNKEIRELFIKGKIKNYHNTLGQQICEFKYLNDDISAKNLTKLYLISYSKPNININVSISNLSGNTFELYSLVNTHSSKNSNIKYSTSRLISGFINSTDFYQYKLKLEIWD